MFTHNELMHAMQEGEYSNSLPLEVMEFDHQDFISPCSEQLIRLVCGTKKAFNNGLLFWIKTLQSQDWPREDEYFFTYLHSGLCEPINEEEFTNIVTNYSSSLRKPLPTFLTRLDGYKSGLRMYGDWNDVAVVGELNDMFVAFFWATTA